MPGGGWHSLEEIRRAIGLAERLEIPNLVLGSPKQRVRPKTMSPQTAIDRAIETLRPLADSAESAGVKIAMECNPVEYGTNFLVTPSETLAFVQCAAHSSITLNFDVGATHLTQTFTHVEGLLRDAGDWISHVHISEPFLGPAPADPLDAARVLRTLQSIGYTNAISIEMRRPRNGLHGLDSALRNLAAAKSILEFENRRVT